MLLRRSKTASAAPEPAHEPFIDSLIKRKLVLLGGSFSPSVGDADAAYVLRCDSVEDAEVVVAEDPLVRTGVARPECVEWRLVGIDPDVIDPELT